MKYKKDTTIKRILFCFYILNDIKSNGVNNNKVYIHLSLCNIVQYYRGANNAYRSEIHKSECYTGGCAGS